MYLPIVLLLVIVVSVWAVRLSDALYIPDRDTKRPLSGHLLQLKTKLRWGGWAVTLLSVLGLFLVVDLPPAISFILILIGFVTGIVWSWFTTRSSWWKSKVYKTILQTNSYPSAKADADFSFKLSMDVDRGNPPKQIRVFILKEGNWENVGSIPFEDNADNAKLYLFALLSVHIHNRTDVAKNAVNEAYDELMSEYRTYKQDYGDR